MNILTQFIRKCHKIYSELNTIKYNGISIDYYSINAFDITNKCNNDKNNKIRETTIVCIINDAIPSMYFKYSNRWTKLKKEINRYIQMLCNKNNIVIQTQHCVPKAGRKYNYDILLIVNNVKEFHIEFKFNASQVKDIPQFVSTMKPSSYLQSSYEEFYYDNFLGQLAQKYGLTMPDKTEYLHNVTCNNKPKCVEEFQNKYYNGCKQSSQYTGLKTDIEFYKQSKILSKESIVNFISNNDLKIIELTKYLLDTQQDKIYMLYKNGNLHYQTIETNNYEIVSYKKDAKKQRYIATTKSGNELKILLRWKNGNGIAFTSLQIS